MNDPIHFKALLDETSDINLKDSSGQTLLMRAASENNKQIVLILLDKEIDVSKTDLGARSALDYAIYNNAIDVFTLILDRSPKLLNDRNYIEGILLSAIELNKSDFVNFLLQKKFPINVKLEKTNLTILHSALEYAHQNKEVIQLIVKKEADVNFVESDGKSPIFRLKYNANIECLKALISGGANLNQRDKENHTVMFYWANNKQFSFIKEILNHGAIPELGMYAIDRTERSYTSTKNKIEYQHAESLKFVPSEYGGIVNKKVDTTETVTDEIKIPILEFVAKHDIELYNQLKSRGYK